MKNFRRWLKRVWSSLRWGIREAKIHYERLSAFDDILALGERVMEELDGEED